MRIPTGHFGNAVPTPQPTRVNVSGTGAIGQAVAGLAGDVKQEINAVVRARAGDAMLDYQIKLKDINESIRRGVEDGTLRADQVENVYHDAVGKLEKPQFAGLGIAETQVAESGLKRYESDGLTTVQGYARAALKIEARDQVDSGLDKLGKLANYPGADIEKINAMSAAYEEQGRIGYGAQWAKVRQGWIDKNWFNQAQQKLMEARDNGAALSDFNNQLTSEKGFYIDKLDPDKRKALLNQAMGYQSRLEAKAIAAQNHADMLVLRRENAATHASSSMQMRIANGEIPTDQDWNTYLTTTAGTSQEGTASTLRRAMVTTQKLYAMPPEQAQAQIDNWTLEMRKHGGSEEAYKVLNAVQQNIDQRRTELQKNPQAVGAMDAGTELQPLDARSAIQTPGEWGQGLQARLINSKAISQKYGPAAGKNLLTPSEASDTTEYYQNLTPAKRVQFWRNTAASGGTEVANRLAREVGGNALPVAAVASMANTPQGYRTALTIERGVSLINPVDGVAKAQVPKASSISEAIQDEYPDFTAVQVQRFVPVVTAYHVGKGGAPDDTPSSDDLHAVIGEPVEVFGGSVVAPPGSHSKTFKAALTTQINRLPERLARTVKHNLKAGIFTFIPDDSGNMVLVNIKAQRPVSVGGKPFVAEVK